jgi:hypothetical protein
MLPGLQETIYKNLYEEYSILFFPKQGVFVRELDFISALGRCEDNIALTIHKAKLWRDKLIPNMVEILV